MTTRSWEIKHVWHSTNVKYGCQMRAGIVVIVIINTV